MNKIGNNIPGEATGQEPLRRRTNASQLSQTPPEGSPTLPPGDQTKTKEPSSSPHPGDSLTMQSFALEIGAMTRAQFLEKYPYHFLIQESHLESGAGQPGYFTLKAPIESAQPCDLLSTKVYALKKKHGELFQDMITVGRAANNDVVIDYSCVSKFHACFTRAGSQWLVTDSGSTNGTYLEKKALEPRVSKPLDVDAELAFSTKLSFRFVDASRLFNYLDYFRKHIKLT